MAPLHCLLLRGSAATIVRCWSSDTRLNGKFFTDSVLAPNDRLSVGPIELEVLDVGATSPVQEWEIQHEELRNAANRQREQLAARSAELEAERNALATERDDLETQRKALADDRWQWQARQERFSGRSPSSVSNLPLDWPILNRKQTPSRQSGATWKLVEMLWPKSSGNGRLGKKTQRSIDRQREQLKAQLAELELQRTALLNEPPPTDPEVGRGIDERREQVDAQLAELQSQRKALATERDGLQAQQDALTEERRQWQARQEQAQREIEGQREQLAARSAELESQRKELAAERNDANAKSNVFAEERRQWQTEQEEARQGIDEQRERLAARSAELESQRNALAAERHALEAQRGALAEHRQQWHAQYEETQRAINEQREQLAARIGRARIAMERARGRKPPAACQASRESARHRRAATATGRRIGQARIAAGRFGGPGGQLGSPAERAGRGTPAMAGPTRGRGSADCDHLAGAGRYATSRTRVAAQRFDSRAG